MLKNKFTIIIGDTFGRLTVLREASPLRRKKRVFCGCKCGKIINVDIYSLKHGNTQSCGCLSLERRVSASILACTKHGEANGSKRTAEYAAWIKMKERCYWKKSNRYYRYGGRGIKVCERWLNSYENFLSDMGRKPSIRYSLDRIDNDKDYSPENCKWSTIKDQMNNTSSTRWITIDNKKKSCSEWAQDHGLSCGLILERIKRGWSEKDSVFRPINIKYRNKLCQKL